MNQPSKHPDLRVIISNKQILKIALPISAAIIVPQINFITNNIFLGGLGQQSLAVAGITGVYYLIFAVVGIGLNNGLQALIARRAGENRVDEIGNLFSQGVRIAIVLAIVGMLLTWFIAPAILKWSLHDEKNVRMAINFLNIRIVGLLFLYLYQMRNALLVGTNQSKYLIIGTASESVANIILDYALIYGKFGLPAMGFNGAAYASVMAEFIGLFVIFLVIHYNGISKQLHLFKNFYYHAGNTKLILKQSSPLIAQHAISIISWEFFYILIEHHGERDLAVSNTMRNIFGFFGCFTWAFAATTSTMVSNIIGQGMQDRVIELIHKILKLSFIFSVTVAIIVNTFSHVFLSMYGQGEDFIIAAIPVLRVVSVALVLMSVSVIWLNAVTGTGSSKVNLMIEAFTIIIYCIYVYVVLEKLKWPITIGWGSEWVYWTCSFLPSYWYIKSGRWKKRKI